MFTECCGSLRGLKLPGLEVWRLTLSSWRPFKI
jgi:hypothetical protein